MSCFYKVELHRHFPYWSRRTRTLGSILPYELNFMEEQVLHTLAGVGFISHIALFYISENQIHQNAARKMVIVDSCLILFLNRQKKVLILRMTSYSQNCGIKLIQISMKQLFKTLITKPLPGLTKILPSSSENILIFFHRVLRRHWGDISGHFIHKSVRNPLCKLVTTYKQVQMEFILHLHFNLMKCYLIQLLTHTVKLSYKCRFTVLTNSWGKSGVRVGQ